MKALFLDDMIQRHKVFHKEHGHQFETTYVVSYDEFVEAMEFQSYDILFLDHDLSIEAIDCDPDNIDELTGTDVANWIVTKWLDGYVDQDKPGIVVHSLNPAGRQRMVEILSKNGFDAIDCPFTNLRSLRFS